MKSNLKTLMSTAAVAALTLAFFAGVPAFAADCNDQFAQANPDQRDPANARFAQDGSRDPHNSRFAQANPDSRDPHDSRFAQANPDQRDPHSSRFAQDDSRDPHNSRFAQDVSRDPHNSRFAQDDSRDPHNSRFAQDDSRDPHNSRFAQANPDQRDPHSSRFAQDDSRDPHNSRFTQANPDQRDPHDTRFTQANPDRTSYHRYFFRAVYTAEGMKDLQKRGATALGENVAKFDASVGCRLEVWYFDYAESANYGFVDCPNEIAMATIAATANAAGYVHLTMRPVLTPPEMDQALARSQSIRPPQQQ